MSYIGNPKKGFNVLAYNQQKRDRESNRCPKCATALQRKALTDSDQRVITGPWRYCEKCGWEDRAARQQEK